MRKDLVMIIIVVVLLMLFTLKLWIDYENLLREYKDLKLKYVKLKYRFNQLLNFSKRFLKIEIPNINIENETLSSEVDILVNNLTSNVDNVDEVIRKLTTWIYYNIQYNTSCITLHTVTEILRKRCGVCQQKAYLLYTLLNHYFITHNLTNFKAYLVTIEVPELRPIGHALVLLSNGSKFALIDPTYRLWSSFNNYSCNYGTGKLTFYRLNELQLSIKGTTCRKFIDLVDSICFDVCISKQYSKELFKDIELLEYLIKDGKIFKYVKMLKDVVKDVQHDS